MIDPLKAFLEAHSIKTPLFPQGSRYYGLDTGIYQTPDKRTIVYLRRRFVPPPERSAAFQEHTIVQRDRLDNIAHRYIGDPEKYWRLCDGNRAMRPDELIETIGRRIRITLPEGIPG